MQPDGPETAAPTLVALRASSRCLLPRAGTMRRRGAKPLVGHAPQFVVVQPERGPWDDRLGQRLSRAPPPLTRPVKAERPVGVTVPGVLADRRPLNAHCRNSIGLVDDRDFVCW